MKKTVSMLLAAGLIFGTTAGNNPAGKAYADSETAAVTERRDFNSNTEIRHRLIITN